MRKKLSKSVLSVINYGSFPGKILFCCGFTYEEICKVLKKQKCDEWLQAFQLTKDIYDGECAGYASTRTIIVKGKACYYDFLIIKKAFDYNRPYDHITLAHEAIHIATFNLKSCMDIVKENEGFAYTHSHIMDQCYKLLFPDL